jgi:hypothetical protein
LSRTNIRAATLYSVGRNDSDHDAVLRIGSESSRRRAHSAQRHESQVFAGPRHLEPSSAIPHRGADRTKTVRLLSVLVDAAVGRRISDPDRRPARLRALTTIRAENLAALHGDESLFDVAGM